MFIYHLFSVISNKLKGPLYETSSEYQTPLCISTYILHFCVSWWSGDIYK